MKKNILILLIAVSLLVGIMSVTRAEVFMWNEDRERGTYTTAVAYVSGYWYYPPGELRRAYACVKGIVNSTLPLDGIVVGFQFQWDGYDTGWHIVFSPDVDEPGEELTVEVRPGTVTYIIASGRVGYGYVVDNVLYYCNDTREVSASLPFV